MKEVWIAVMAFSMGGYFGFLISGINRYDSKGYDIWTIILLVSSVISIFIGIWAFRQAAKIGRKEDKERETNKHDAGMQIKSYSEEPPK